MNIKGSSYFEQRSEIKFFLELTATKTYHKRATD